MSLNLNDRSYSNGNHVLAWYVTFYIITKYTENYDMYTYSNGKMLHKNMCKKNGIVQVASVSRRSAFVTSIP